MRKQKRYKIYKLINTNLKRFPLKVLVFHRPKWTKLKRLLSTFNRKPRLLNLQVIKSSFKTWDRVKKHHKLLVVNRNVLDCIFDGSVRLDKIFSKKNTNKKKIINCFLKLYFRVDILLNHLNFFSTSYQAREFINNNNVTVNKKFVRSNYFLKRGDIVEFDKVYLKTTSFKTILKKFSGDVRLNTFLEVDYYTQSFLVLKDFNSFSKDDLSLCVTNYLNVRNLM
jgi:ribosomal protein S4